MNIDQPGEGTPGEDVGVALLGDGVTVGIVRVGDTVRRPRRPFTETVQTFLAHLHERGFTAAPVPMGYDGEAARCCRSCPVRSPASRCPAGLPPSRCWSSSPYWFDD